jgi:hypothetical protein
MGLLLANSCLAQRVDSSTLKGKVLVGYQGWFRCAGDGSSKDGWYHWFHGAKDDPTTAEISDPATRTWRVDQYPDLTGMDPSSLCAVPNLQIDGRQAYVFSSYPKATADTHFKWMREYGIDGALMQRFVGVIPRYRSERDAVLQNSTASAEKYGRVIAVEYDISGGKEETVFDLLKSDWLYVMNDLKLTASPAYLHEKGKPVVSIWGLGVKGRIANPELALTIVRWFKTEGHATVMGGVPPDWARGAGDAQSDPRWAAVYKELDVVQPWTPGRYKDAATADAWRDSHLVPDIELTQHNQQQYMPVIFPGFSWHNSKRDDTPTDRTNRIPRQAGTFLWVQAMNAKAAGATMVKIAMFDEINEGTAVFKTAPTHTGVPSEAPFVTMDQDGIELPSDWYLRVVGEIGRVYHGQVPIAAKMPLQIPKAGGSR